MKKDGGEVVTIENDHQLGITSRWVKEFEKALADLHKRSPEDSSDMIRKVLVDAMESEIEVLKDQIREYEEARQ